MLFKKKPAFIICTLLLVLAVSLPGCSAKPKISADGYVKLVSLQGNGNRESKQFSITVSDNRFNIKTTENNADGIKGQILKDNGSVGSSFNAGSNPVQDVWPLKLQPGKYTIKVESTGTKYEISMEEKYTAE